MAPALTQTAEPPLLADAACHSPSESNIHVFPPYVSLLKEVANSRFRSNTKKFFESGRTFLTNGDCVSNGVAPPASGWAEGSPAPNFSPLRTNMDELPLLSTSDSGSNSVSPSPAFDSHVKSPNTKMGLTSCLKNVTLAATDQVHCGEVTNGSCAGQTNDLLSLVGRDFDNVNEIIDTLQRLASNPELLDPSGGEIDSSQGSATSEICALQLLSRLIDRQRMLERRRLFLLRRLRRVNSKVLNATITGQLSDAAHHVKNFINDELSKEAPLKQPLVDLDFLHEDSMKSMSTSDLISLVRRVEASTHRKSNKVYWSSSPVPPSLPPPLCAEIDAVATEMRGAAVLAHTSYDSDATESSSGGESCDEDDSEFNSINTDYKPIRERAFYKYCRMRGWVASRWTWLQAQVADIDYRILQQQKLLSHLRESKGPVRLMVKRDEASTKRAFSTRSPAHFDMQDPALTCISPINSRVYLNGYYHSPNRVNDQGSSTLGSTSLDRSPSCSRTSGVEKVKRRRYVRPSVSFLKRGFGGGRNFRKTSYVQCKCVPPFNCIMCTKSRTNKSIVNYSNQIIGASKLRPATFSNLSVASKLSRIDDGFHSVLSHPSEMLQGDHFGSCLKKSDELNKFLSTQSLNDKNSTVEVPPNSVSSSKSDPSLDSDHLPLPKRSKRDREHKRNGRRKVCKEDTFRETETQSSFLPYKKNLDNVEDTDDEVAFCQASASGSGCSSPCPSPAFFEKSEKSVKGVISETKSNRKSSSSSRQKLNSASYDINNIVIPYGLVASSRVEHLEYKEIPTPEWRVQELDPLQLTSSELLEIEDDISEELMIARHSRSEEMERKKFLAYAKTQINPSSRSTRTRRADSSGTNTPDHPLSPRNCELLDSSPVNSPLDSCLIDPSEEFSNQSTMSSSTKLSSAPHSTVLSLSLSSFHSSLLKNASEDTKLRQAQSIDIEHCLNGIPSLKTSSEHPIVCSNLLSRPRRTSSPNITHIEKMNSDEVVDEMERLSPFPSREFPLDETEYEGLVHENIGTAINTPTDASSLLVNSLPADSDAKELAITHSRTEIESGQNTPLSELTDSAPEEDTSSIWDDKESTDWTISAINDSRGGFVLAVQKN